jgi:hypothetical protein
MRLRGKRIAARVAADGPNADTMTPDWKAVMLADPCVYCCERGGIELEHIQPRKRGGRNGWTNIAPACKAHNTMKAEYPLWWMLWRLHEQRLGFTRQQAIAYRGGRPVKWMTVYTRMLRRRAVAKDRPTPSSGSSRET